MGRGYGRMLGAALLGVLGCSDGGTGPAGEGDGLRLARQFDQLADSVDSAGYSPTAEALRHAAQIVKLTGHATPVTVTIDGAHRSFLAVAEQLDFPQLQCSWPSDSGVVPPGDTIIVEPGDSGSGGSGSPPDTMLTASDSVVNPPVPGSPGQCMEVGTFSMRTLIAWEPEHMAEVVRIVADVGSSDVEASVPDVMTGLPTNMGRRGTTPPTAPPVPGDSAGGGGGSGGGAIGFPGFMGEYLVRDVGRWFAVEGSQSNSLSASGGACTSDRATFDWAEFTCEAAQFRFEFTMRVESLRFVDPMPMPESSPPQPDGEHALAMGSTNIDGVRLSVIAWAPPPAPPPPPPSPGPNPIPPDSAVTGR